MTLEETSIVSGAVISTQDQFSEFETAALVISHEEMKYFIKIIKSLKELAVWLNCVSYKIENETKKETYLLICF